jgi:predicted short-subunit dehydrogenase-like oxidoreductase (DUF2520 family)
VEIASNLDLETRSASHAIVVVGAGRVGTALAVLWERAGHRVVAASGRQASRERVERFLPHTTFLPADEAAPLGTVVVVAVPDDHIEHVVDGLAAAGSLRPGQFVAHLSGSTGLDVLDAAADAGAGAMSLHPLQSFPDVETGIARMPGSGVAITARTEANVRVGEALAGDAGGVPFRLEDVVKPLYHAAAVFCSNYLVTVQGIAEDAMRRAGIDAPLPLLAPLARTAFDRTFELGPGDALTGPAVRGDVGTIERNLQALAEGAPEAVDAYLALATSAARLAAAAGRLAPHDRARVEEALERWR